MVAVDVQKRQVRAAGIASLTGWAMDLYDLLVILYLASTIGPLLFPAQAPTLQLALTYASFAVTLLMRPVGSAIFGAYADRRGRKRTMMVAIGGVGICTALMGAVPTYATAGLLAPALFLLLRLTQGVFVGGVVAATHTLGTETVAPRHRGMMSAVIASGGGGLGAVLASVVFLIVSSALPGASFTSYGWRIMFFTGLLTAVLSFYVYRRTAESPLWQAQREQAQLPATRSPLRQVLSARYAGTLAWNIVVTATGASLYYLTLGFFPTLLATNLHLPGKTVAWVLIAGNLVAVFFGLAIGRLSDVAGRRPAFLVCGVAGLLARPAGFFALSSGPRPTIVVALLVTVMGGIGLAASAPALIFLNERFPTPVRATGTALSWNIGFALGGMMPTAVTLLSPDVGSIPSRLAIFCAIAAALLIVAVLVVGETRHRGLDAGSDAAALAPGGRAEAR